MVDQQQRRTRILEPVAATSAALPAEETSNQERLSWMLPRAEAPVTSDGPWLDEPELGVGDFLAGLRATDGRDPVGGIVDAMPSTTW